MTQKAVESILALNRKSYQTIASLFSQTRQHGWDDFKWLDEYVQEGMSILDIGCGNGRLFEYLSSKKIYYTGIDLSTNFIHIAKSRYKGHEMEPKFYEGDILALNDIPELKNKQFDLIIGVAVLCHTPMLSHKGVVEQIKKLISLDGTLILYNWNLWQVSARKSVWNGLKERLMTTTNQWMEKYGIGKDELGLKDVMTIWRSNGVMAPLYYYCFTLSELRKLLQNCGYKVSSLFYTKNGVKAHWYNGKNSVVIAKNN